jgi:hypothetical protein
VHPKACTWHKNIRSTDRQQRPRRDSTRMHSQPIMKGSLSHASSGWRGENHPIEDSRAACRHYACAVVEHEGYMHKTPGTCRAAKLNHKQCTTQCATHGNKEGSACQLWASVLLHALPSTTGETKGNCSFSVHHLHSCRCRPAIMTWRQNSINPQHLPRSTHMRVNCMSPLCKHTLMCGG